MRRKISFTFRFFCAIINLSYLWPQGRQTYGISPYLPNKGYLTHKHFTTEGGNVFHAYCVYGAYSAYTFFDDCTVFDDYTAFVVFTISYACRILQTTIKLGSADQTGIRERAHGMRAIHSNHLSDI